MVEVLPVPALASSSVIPLGNGPQTSNTPAGEPVIGSAAVTTSPSSRGRAFARQEAVPQPHRVATQSGLLVARPRRAVLVGMRRLGEQLLERHLPVENTEVHRVEVL